MYMRINNSQFYSTIFKTPGFKKLDTKIPTPTVYGEMPVWKLQLSRTAFHPHNLQCLSSNLSKLNTRNTAGISLHVSTYSQHVSFIMLAKSDHVATVDIKQTAEMWGTFGIVVRAVDGKEIDYAACKTCLTVHTFKPGTGTSSLIRHVCAQQNDNHSKGRGIMDLYFPKGK